MYTQVNVIVNGMREEHTRLSLENAMTATLKEAFSIALRVDFRVTKAYTKPTVDTVAQSSGPEPMKYDMIESSDNWRTATRHKSDVRSGDKWFAFVVES